MRQFLAASFGGLVVGVVVGGCEIVGGIHERSYREPATEAPDGSAGGEGASAGHLGPLSGGGLGTAGTGGTAGAAGAGGVGALDASHVGRGGAGGASAAGFAEGGQGEAGRRDAASPDGQNTCVSGGTEDCTDGVDNNCDGLIDCADPTCRAAGYQCVPVPSGWLGPAAIWTGNAGSAPDKCGPGLEVALSSVYRDLTVPPSTCQCSCGTPASRTCDGITMNLYANDVCGDPFATATAHAGSCGAIVYTLAGGAVFTASVASRAPSGGTCAPAVVASVPKATWNTELRACSRANSGRSLGCAAADEHCTVAPDPGAPYRTGLCVYRVGDPPATSCPAGYGEGPLVFYSEQRDTRACSGCSCTPPTGGSCSGTFSIYYRPQCDQKAVAFDVEGGCQSMMVDSDKPNTFTSNLVVKDPGACAKASEAQAAGTVEGTGAVTVCCAP